MIGLLPMLCLLCQDGKKEVEPLDSKDLSALKKKIKGKFA